MKFKVIKKNWHRTNKNFVFNYFNGICQVCKLEINKNLTKFDIHHLHYNMNKTPIKSRLYETDAKTLIENNVIVLICRKCHDIEHTAIDNQNPKQLENKTNCEICGKLEYGIFGRKKHQKLNQLLCRKCFLNPKLFNPNQLLLF
jgi:hypothetical protein